MGRLSLKWFTGEGLEGGLFYWGFLLMKGRLWRRVSLQQIELGSFTGDYEILLKVALKEERLSLWELYEGNLEGGLPCWGSWRICRKVSGDWNLFP